MFLQRLAQKIWEACVKFVDEWLVSSVPEKAVNHFLRDIKRWNNVNNQEDHTVCKFVTLQSGRLDMKSIYIFLTVFFAASFSVFAAPGPGDCIAVIYHDSSFVSPDPQDRDIPFTIVRWDEVNLTNSALPIIMIKVKFDVFGAGSELRFSGALYYNVVFVEPSSHNPESELIIKEFSQPSNARIHEMRSDGRQILGKSIPNSLAKSIMDGAHVHYYTTEDSEFVDLQDRARDLDVGVCSIL